jgi:CubicO group peptidase (beta-lactamase class C family)
MVPVEEPVTRASRRCTRRSSRTSPSAADVGAAVAVSVGGRPVVDLWGGWADAARRRPWRRDTLVNVFSCSKGLSTLCALQLVERGLVDLDAPIARLWPAFAAAGKEGITLRQVLTHRAGSRRCARRCPTARCWIGRA